MKVVVSKILAVVVFANIFCGMSFTASAQDLNTELEAAKTSAAGDTESKTPITFTGTGITMEAESFTPKDKDDAVTAKGNDASGGSAVYFKSNLYQLTPASSEAADFDLSFVAPKTAKYNIWARVKKKGSGVSCFLSVGKDAAYGYFELTSNAEYVWIKLASARVTLNDTYYIRLMHRHENMYYDKFIITSDMDALPMDKDATHEADFSDISALPSGIYNVPSIKPNGQHPSLWFTSSDIPTIKKNFSEKENKAYYDRYIAIKDTSPANLSTYLSTRLDVIEAKAFDYAISKNYDNGRAAYNMFMEHSEIADYSGAPFPYRSLAHLIITGAKVYDWCYDIISADEKTYMIRRMEILATELECKYPPASRGVVTSHNGEEQFFSAMIGIAIATYSERPDIYNYVVGQLIDEYVPPRNYWYKSHSHYQEIDYGMMTRHGWELHCAYMMYKATGAHVFNYEDMGTVMYYLIYNMRPDGQTVRLGDNWTQSYSNTPAYWTTYFTSLYIAASYFKDPYLKREMARENVGQKTLSAGNSGELSPVLWLIVNDPTVGSKSSADLPLSKYFPSPEGSMTARTGWSDGVNSPDVHAHMKIGEMWGGNHAHLDMGSFTLYYKGALAIDSGLYAVYGGAHHYKYTMGGIAHNIVTVYDPSEVVPSNRKNDGGYRWPNGGGEASNLNIWLSNYTMGKVIGHEIGPDTYAPEYSYISGDLTNAYSDKVTDSMRSMVFMPLEDEEHPAALVVFDNVTSKDASFKKSWLLHMQEAPSVSGNKTVVTRTQNGYNGRMVNETLLPKDAAIEKIGGEGKEFWVVDQNFSIDASYAKYKNVRNSEVGWGRVEVSPASANKTDYFLNVMTVSDADTTAPDIQSTLIESGDFAGAAFSDRAVVFYKKKERMSMLALVQKSEFTVPAGTKKVLICGLKAGTWDVNGTTVVASEDGGCVYADVSGTKVTLKYKNSSANKVFTSNKPDIDDVIGIKTPDAAYLYSHTNPIIENNTVMIDMYNIMKGLGADVTKTERSVTAALNGFTVTAEEGSSVVRVNDIAFSIDEPAKAVNGDLMVPLSLVKVFNYKITNEPYANIYIIEPAGSGSGAYEILNASPAEEQSGNVIIRSPGNVNAKLISASYDKDNSMSGITCKNVAIKQGINIYSIGTQLQQGTKIMLWKINTNDSAVPYGVFFEVK